MVRLKLHMVDDSIWEVDIFKPEDVKVDDKFYHIYANDGRRYKLDKTKIKHVTSRELTVGS